MKTLHVPFTFYPEPVGGTEVYVAALAAALTRQGHPAVVAAPGDRDAEYTAGSLRVHRFASSDSIDDLSDLYDEGDPEAALRFARILDRERPDLVHLHAFTRTCSLRLVRTAHQHGVPVVFTYHTPTMTCQRGTLMYWGESPCDGVLDTRRCTACSLHGLGVPKTIAQALAAIPPAVGRQVPRFTTSAITALRLSSLIDARHMVVRSLLAEVDRIVALNEWAKTLLTANGVPADRVAYCRHGLSQPAAVSVTRRPSTAIQAAFLGRVDRTKGIDRVVRAFQYIPADVPLHLNVFATVQGADAEHQLNALGELASRERRIEFKAPLSPEQVLPTLAEHDVLIVPSQWMETGPLVVLEAFAVGVPVIGSALGGIAELVADGVNGALVADFRSPQAWADALIRFARHPELRETLRAGIKPPRTMDTVAGQMLDVYKSVIGKSVWARPAPARTIA